jgi:hypothetical protein
MAGALVTTNILGTVVAMGLATLREQLALVHIANRDYETEITAAKRFATVNVAVPAAVATRTVAPDVVPPAVTAVTPSTIPVTLSQWKEAPFAMDDKGLSQVDRGILPMQAKEAIKGMANTIEDFLWSLTHAAGGFYGFAGVSGTTPFATDLSGYLDARKIGNNQLMDMDPRYMVINTDAEANALGLRAFQDASFRGDTDGIINGQIGRKLGALWLMSQRVPTHTAGTYVTGSTITGVNAIGATVLAISGGATGTLLPGDIISFSHEPGITHQVQTTVGGGTITSITIEPFRGISAGVGGLVIASAGGETITKKASFVMNTLIHRDAIAFAMAPLLDTIQVPGATLTATAVDEVSGLALRLEVTRQHRQVQWSFDALYGGSIVRTNAGVFLGG